MGRPVFHILKQLNGVASDVVFVRVVVGFKYHETILYIVLHEVTGHSIQV